MSPEAELPEAEFIVYACPVGELADQLDRYFQKSRSLYGPNAAHQYMPHCTLTGFFQDGEEAIARYTDALDRTFAAAPTPPNPVLSITHLNFRPDWHGLELESNWLKQRIADFAQLAQSPTRPLRLKNWLHLSLAYQFHPDQSAPLQHLAEQLIHPQSPVAWELRFYQRHPNHNWTCHHAFPLRGEGGGRRDEG